MSLAATLVQNLPLSQRPKQKSQRVDSVQWRETPILKRLWEDDGKKKMFYTKRFNFKLNWHPFIWLDNSNYHLWSSQQQQFLGVIFTCVKHRRQRRGLPDEFCCFLCFTGRACLGGGNYGKILNQGEDRSYKFIKFGVLVEHFILWKIT